MTEQLKLNFTSGVKVGVSQLGIFSGSESFFFFFFFEALQSLKFFILFYFGVQLINKLQDPTCCNEDGRPACCN